MRIRQGETGSVRDVEVAPEPASDTTAAPHAADTLDRAERGLRKVPAGASLIDGLSAPRAQTTSKVDPAPLDVAALRAYVEKTYPGRDFSHLVFVSVRDQKLYRLVGWEVCDAYPVSTGKTGISSRNKSGGTPAGLHTIAERIGDGLPKGALIKHGKYLGYEVPITEKPEVLPGDYITTRVLRLQGEEPGKNRGAGIDTHGRGIYIHGTDEEGLIGTPVSHGCVRMKNDDVVALFEALPSGTPVLILPTAP